MVSPEPLLIAHTSSESRGAFRQKARSLAPLNGWACAVKICHDGMLKDTNSFDGAHLKSVILTVWFVSINHAQHCRKYYSGKILGWVSWQPADRVNLIIKNNTGNGKSNNSPFNTFKKHVLSVSSLYETLNKYYLINI